MSHRTEPPAAGVVVPMRAAVPERRAIPIDVPKASPARRAPLTTAAGLVSATASAWRVQVARASGDVVPAFGVVSAGGEVRRRWSRGPRR